MGYLQLLRPKQWVKNVFVFLPLFFDKGFGDVEKLLRVIAAFIAFCFIASAIYCFNDIFDREADRLHYKKRHRPVASGKVSVKEAYILMTLCVIVSVTLCFVCLTDSIVWILTVIGIYFIINILYCIILKRFAIVDVFCISIGFVLRLVAGGIAGDVALSQWIVIMTFLIALFMAFAKRRDDVVAFNKTGILTRKNVSGYNIQYMNMILAVIASMTMICYIMYTLTDDVISLHGTEYLYVTSIFVLAGLFRYLQITIVDERSGSPTELIYNDRFLQASVLLWIASFAAIIYLL